MLNGRSKDASTDTLKDTFKNSQKDKMNIANDSALQVNLRDEQATVDFGAQLAEAAKNFSLTIYLCGDLGAGKTTMSRGIVQYFGHRGAVKSPTYTLVEPYELEEKSIFHFDLYRMAAADELSYLGLEDYFNTPNRLCLVEWPEKGEGVLPAADLTLALEYRDQALDGRIMKLSAATEAGKKCLEELQNNLPKTEFK